MPLSAPTSTQGRPPQGTRTLDRTTAAGMTAETTAEEAEEAGAVPAERAPGDADRQSIAAGQAGAEAVCDDRRNHHGPEDEGGAAAAQSRTGASSSRASGGLGTADYTAADPAAEVFLSSQQRHEAREEGEVERRAVYQADDEAQEGEVVLAASAMEREGGQEQSGRECFMNEQMT
ncbi:unnamed protein product [Closterium sp. Naga37s-1]|nr:unnamed protein product [Closterium sp. Naga37s-1]